MKIMHLPSSHIGVGDKIVLALGAYQLPVSVEVWNRIKDDQGVIRFYVKESTQWQLTAHETETLAVIR